MSKMTPILLRIEPEALEVLDRTRGDVPRAVFVRKVLREYLAAQGAVRVSPEVFAQLRKVAAEKPAAAPFKSRLKGEWKAP